MFISNYIVDETVNRSLLKHGSRVITVKTNSAMSERSFVTGLLSSQGSRHINLENISSLEGLKSRVGELFGIVEPRGESPYVLLNSVFVKKCVLINTCCST